MIAYLPKEKLEFMIREGVKDDKDVLWEMFGENVYQVDAKDLDDQHTILDIGANIGAFSIFATSLVEDAKCFAIEPDPNNLQLLHQNIKLNRMNDYIKVYDVAVGEEYGRAISNDRAGSTVVLPKIDGPITMLSLLGLCEEIQKDHDVIYFDLLKMDIEGGEYAAFRLAPDWLMKRFKYITLEFHAATSTEFGWLISKLSETHNVHTIGSWDKGGNIYARIY